MYKKQPCIDQIGRQISVRQFFVSTKSRSTLATEPGQIFFSKIFTSDQVLKKKSLDAVEPLKRKFSSIFFFFQKCRFFEKLLDWVRCFRACQDQPLRAFEGASTLASVIKVRHMHRDVSIHRERACQLHDMKMTRHIFLH